MKAKIGLAAVSAATLLALAPASAPAGIVGQWKLDEGSGATAADSSGLGNTGSVFGGSLWGPGHFGSSLTLDGSGRVAVAAASSLEPAAVTVTAWVRRTGSPGGFKYIVAKGATGCIAASFGLYTGPYGGAGFYVSNNGGLNFTRSPLAGEEVWDGTWHHLAGTFDGADVRLYVDGTEVATGTPRTEGIDYATLDGRGLFIGRYEGCGGALDLDGSVDDVRVYDRAMSASEIPSTMTIYTFTGFFAPIDKRPTVNVTKGGSAVPVKFSLAGYQGMGILAAGSPSSRQVSCGTGAQLDDIESTSTAGSSSLSYNQSSDQYSYVWKTEKSWTGTCRQLTVTLSDGSAHSADFRFK